MKNRTTQKLTDAIRPMERFLVEFVCTGCLESKFHSILQLSPMADFDWIDRIEHFPEWNGMDPKDLMHWSKAEGTGWSLCGKFRAVQVWKRFEKPADPKGYLGELMTMDPETAKKIVKGMKRRSNGVFGSKGKKQ